MHFELGVDVGEVDEEEGVGTRSAGHPLPHTFHHDDHLPMPDSALQLLRLGTGLDEGGRGDGGDGKEEQQEGV